VDVDVIKRDDAPPSVGQEKQTNRAGQTNFQPLSAHAKANANGDGDDDGASDEDKDTDEYAASTQKFTKEKCGETKKNYFPVATFTQSLPLSFFGNFCFILF